MGRWIVDTGSQDRHRCYAVAIDAGDQMRLDAAAGDALTFAEAERYITRMRKRDAAARAAAVAERGRANLERWRAHVRAAKAAGE